MRHMDVQPMTAVYEWETVNAINYVSLKLLEKKSVKMNLHRMFE